MTRPNCFEFAMGFLGSSENAEVLRYVEKLEHELGKCQIKLASKAKAVADITAAEIERLRKDAERYQYLRSRVPSEVFAKTGVAAGCWIDCEDGDGTLVLLTGEDADAAVDDAMAVGAA